MDMENIDRMRLEYGTMLARVTEELITEEVERGTVPGAFYVAVFQCLFGLVAHLGRTVNLSREDYLRAAAEVYDDVQTRMRDNKHEHDLMQ